MPSNHPLKYKRKGKRMDEPSAPSFRQMPILRTRPTIDYPGPEEPLDQMPLQPLFPEIANLPSPRRRKELIDMATDEGPSDRVIFEAMSLLRENSRAIARILQRRKRPDAPSDSDSQVPYSTPGKGNGPSPAKRMTPGSASDGGQLNVDAVIASLIGKMALSSSHLRSLEPVEAAEAIGELLLSEKSALLIDQFIDAAIADQDQYLHLVLPNRRTAPESDPSVLPIACNIPSCVNTGTHRCSACKSVYYCSSDCQTRDWKNGHSTICK